MSTTHLPYALVDVFAERALEGNQLAIFTDARGLSTDQMQALARETNLSETTFILPADPAEEARDGVRVRIFTTDEELPFAGHPTLGTASWLHLNHAVLRGASTITLALNHGPIDVTFDAPNGAPGVFATMRQTDPIFGDIHAPAPLAQALGVPLADLDPAYPIQTVSTGMPFCIVPFVSREAIERLAIPQRAGQAWLDASDAKFFYCLTRAGHAAADFHARMQFYAGEDPATGSAAGCAISWLVRHGLVASGAPTIIEQGIQILRPSKIHARATLTGSPHQPKISEVFVAGRTIPVASGQFFRP